MTLGFSRIDSLARNFRLDAKLLCAYLERCWRAQFVSIYDNYRLQMVAFGLSPPPSSSAASHRCHSLTRIDGPLPAKPRSGGETRRSARSSEPLKPDRHRGPGQRRSWRRARAGQAPVLAILAMLANSALRVAAGCSAPLLTDAARAAVRYLGRGKETAALPNKKTVECQPTADKRPHPRQGNQSQPTAHPPGQLSRAKVGPFP